LVCCAILLGTGHAGGAAQRRSSNVQRPRTPARLTIDYSKFSHATKKHQAACNTCHKIPSNNWQKARDFPDITDYPDHDACVSCHRQQFFRGARPVICTVCHTRVSPRDDARFAFRKPDALRQFTIEFPHDKHQDVIARFWPEKKSARSFGFVRASLRLPVQDDKAKNYNNCTICHANLKGMLGASALPDTFKSVPTNHASCFNCHWKSQPPISNDCVGCHKLTKPYGFVDLPTRISIKFRHGRAQHIAECSTCHINITKASTLRGLAPDVPITSCTECHNKDGLRLDVANELAAIDKNQEFVCTYCHSPEKGKLDPPASHYLIAGREPIKRSGPK
ncbi:MAG: cytochrome c3 family protein, partial [Pyrinomonadaceae bacterium]